MVLLAMKTPLITIFSGKQYFPNMCFPPCSMQFYLWYSAVLSFLFLSSLYFLVMPFFQKWCSSSMFCVSSYYFEVVLIMFSSLSLLVLVCSSSSRSFFLFWFLFQDWQGPQTGFPPYQSDAKMNPPGSVFSENYITLHYITWMRSSKTWCTRI